MIYWDSGDSTSTFTELVGMHSQLTQTTYTLSDNVQAGKSYRFKVQSVNKWGESVFSEVISVLAASKPATIDPAAQTTVEISAGDLVITWTTPDANGSAISSYVVEIKNFLGSWIVPSCRQAQILILLQRTCSVPMLFLSQTPFELSFDSLI